MSKAESFFSMFLDFLFADLFLLLAFVMGRHADNRPTKSSNRRTMLRLSER
jgi:hypothetical protein